MQIPKLSQTTLHHVRNLIAPDLDCAVDDGDLRRRLAMNGYGFRDTAHRRVLVTLPHEVELMELPRPVMH